MTTNENNSSPEKKRCFKPLIGFDCPEACPGLLVDTFVADDYGGEGFMIQVCPNPETLGTHNSEADYCGDGPNVITIHRNTMPTEEEYKEAVKNFDW